MERRREVRRGQILEDLRETAESIDHRDRGEGAEVRRGWGGKSKCGGTN